MFESLVIISPKRSSRSLQGWDGFFPYYAGYPEDFSRQLLSSATLQRDAIVLDPWNGSGTTTYSACQLGLSSCGLDLNPVMVTVAKARLLPPSEADSLDPLAREIAKGAKANARTLRCDDPLLWWFEPSTAGVLRALERRICRQLIGARTLTSEGLKLDQMSSLASAFYVALFAVCRQLAKPFRSSNPTWLRKPRKDETLVMVERALITYLFKRNIREMASSLAERISNNLTDQRTIDLRVSDTTKALLDDSSVDLVLTSPPYCTRIDYSAATRIELAVMHYLVGKSTVELSRQMIGSTRVPTHTIDINENWGESCRKFMLQVKRHPSKASESYYYRTHQDYFEKMALSISNISKCLRRGGGAILVVQDSHYKEIHNDLPKITSEMALNAGLKLRRRDDFILKRSMAGINRYRRTYNRTTPALEAVLCFEKIQ